MAELKPFYRSKKWKIGNSFGWWKIPYCPHCKKQLGLMAEEQKVARCPMCNKPLEWRSKMANEKRLISYDGYYAGEVEA